MTNLFNAMRDLLSSINLNDGERPEGADDESDEDNETE